MPSGRCRLVYPANKGLVDAALIEEILKEPSHGIVGEGRDNCGVEFEVAGKPAGHVVFSAAFAYFESARGSDAAVAGVEAEHDLA